MHLLNKAVLLVLVFTALPAFSGEKGQLTLTGQLPAEMKIESISAHYGESYCSTNTITKLGSVSTRKGQFKAKIAFKSEINGIFPACYHSLFNIVLIFSYSGTELGMPYKYLYKTYFTVRGDAAVIANGATVNCGTADGEEPNPYNSCETIQLPTRIGYADNLISSVIVSLTKPSPPNTHPDSLALERDIPEWKMNFKVYKNTRGQVGPGSILEVKSKNSQMPSGLYRIRGVESYASDDKPKMWGSYKLKSGENRHFRFSPFDTYNSVYTDCKYNATAELEITEEQYESDTIKLFCAYK